MFLARFRPLLLPLLLPSLGGCVVDPEFAPSAFLGQPAPWPPVQFALPLEEPDRFRYVIGVDHDPVEHKDSPIPGAFCEDYLGRPFPACYDQHDGSDFILDGGFDAMDAGSTRVLAGAAGRVVSVEQSQYDRCRADVEAGGVTCDGYPVIGNHVILEHEDGVYSKYWHLMTDSVLVEEGEVVRCGQPLALVGSSGNSSLPHLHFEVTLGWGQDEEVVDPFTVDGVDTWWLEQGPTDTMPGSACP